MSGALKSVFGGGNLFGALLSIASIAFPPAALATSLSGLMTSAIGEAVKLAASTLVKEFAMPKFLEAAIGQVADSVVSKLLEQNQSDPAADDHLKNDSSVQQSLNDISKELTNRIVEGTRKNLDAESEQRSGKGKGKSAITTGSWLQAIAKTMGEIAGDKAAQMVELSQKMSDLNSKGQGLVDQLKQSSESNKKGREDISAEQQQNARDFSEVQAQFQATSQEYSILQNTFSNAIKSIGEGLTTMGRKG